ncbi:hypothetical protein PIROE2DRAFT_8324 [Piromyces sp. E2]|nr:hypothetical protein PIROE2DRAFT_8324 [Piromyces sp. E2]|eukprot:OUM64787.1 hypothetical protein PIROE2DRAFT_8324 [Piromyces sp. E2]
MQHELDFFANYIPNLPSLAPFTIFQAGDNNCRISDYISKIVYKDKNANKDNPENRREEVKNILLKRKYVFDPEWDKVYLDSKGIIKAKNNSNNSEQTHNIESVNLSKTQLLEIENKINKQKQENNSFIISTDHKEGLDEYIIKEIDKLPKELIPYKEVFLPPPKGKIFDRKPNNLNAYLPYDKDKEEALEKEFNELEEAGKIEKTRAASASNVFNVPKKDGTFRTVFNFVMVNNCLQIVLPFGLSTAPSIFQSILNLLLNNKLNKGVDIYLDDVM